MRFLMEIMSAIKESTIQLEQVEESLISSNQGNTNEESLDVDNLDVSDKWRNP